MPSHSGVGVGVSGAAVGVGMAVGVGSGVTVISAVGVGDVSRRNGGSVAPPSQAMRTAVDRAAPERRESALTGP
jgi:hypothetical protein